MAPSSNRGRWLMLIRASVVMFLIGTLYSWGIFTEPLLLLFRWNLTTTTLSFGIANFCLAAIGTVYGGFWQDRVGPRKVAMVGISLWGLGNCLAGLGTPTFGAAWLYLTYGVIGGIGAGMAYIAPLALVSKWFSDRRGLAGGVVTASFALGAFIYNQCIPRLPRFHAVAVHAGHLLASRMSDPAAGAFGSIAGGSVGSVASGEVDAVMHVFIASGLAFLLLGLPAACLFRNPAPKLVADHFAAPATGSPDGYPPSKVLVMPQFYLLWLQLFANAIAGLSIISNAVPLIADLTNLSAASIAPLFGTVSICNAAGRFLWGGISDRIGCNKTFIAMFVLQATTLLWLGQAHELSSALTGISIVLLCCGGGFGTMPSYNAQYFGTKYMGLNYGLVLSAWGFAGLIGPTLLARARDSSGSYSTILPAIALVLCVSVILPLVTRPPRTAGIEQE
ncbi:MAG: OFA family MFS transporter [Sinobacteraceae bacterium]|nr:OFA family MFS transporter [Nevskiaceae bacterium]